MPERTLSAALLILGGLFEDRAKAGYPLAAE